MASNNGMTPQQLQTLLVEYQVCQQAVSEKSSGHWSFAGIFLGLSMTAYGFVIPEVFQPHGLGFSIFVTIMSILMILIISFVHGLHLRMRKRTILLYRRMEKIEKLTGMNAQIEQRDIGGTSGLNWWGLVIIALQLLWFTAIVFVWSYA